MTPVKQSEGAENPEGVSRSDCLFEPLAEQAALNGWQCHSVLADRSCWVGKAPEMLANGSQKVHAYLVFHPRNRVMIIPRPGESAEKKSVIKNLSKSVSLGEWTLTVNDFAWPTALSREYLANFWAELFQQVICLEDEKGEEDKKDEKDEKELKKVFSRLLSTIRAGRRFKRDRFATPHTRFRTCLVLLAWELQRVLTKNELGRAFFKKRLKNVPYSKDLAREVTELCKNNGFSWLPTKIGGRPKTVE
jgi:hypothetical protein